MPVGLWDRLVRSKLTDCVSGKSIGSSFGLASTMLVGEWIEDRQVQAGEVFLVAPDQGEVMLQRCGGDQTVRHTERRSFALGLDGQPAH